MLPFILTQLLSLLSNNKSRNLENSLYILNSMLLVFKCKLLHQLIDDDYQFSSWNREHYNTKHHQPLWMLHGIARSIHLFWNTRSKLQGCNMKTTLSRFNTLQSKPQLFKKTHPKQTWGTPKLSRRDCNSPSCKMIIIHCFYYSKPCIEQTRILD